MAKVLLVTDYNGNLHITPVGNKAFYQARNKVVKEKQFKLKEMSESDAYAFVEKNLGRDPEFTTVAGAQRAIADKDAEIAKLKADLAKALENTGDNVGIPEPSNIQPEAAGKKSGAIKPQ